MHRQCTMVECGESYSEFEYMCRVGNSRHLAGVGVGVGVACDAVRFIESSAEVLRTNHVTITGTIIINIIQVVVMMRWCRNNGPYIKRRLQ